MSLMAERMENGTPGAEKPRDFTQWLLDATRKKTPQAMTRLAQHVMGLMFGGAHQLPMLLSFAMYNLCKYPEYIEPLTKEILATRNDSSSRGYEAHDMPLMDSFLKETARLNPTIILTMPRKVMYPFHFSDGTVVPKDNWLCIPQQAIMEDQQYYDEPSAFNGFRFVRQDEDGRATTSDAGKGRLFTTPTFEFPLWGPIRRACPGRFYVSIVAKIVLSHFIMNYDAKLANAKTPQSLAWSFALVPHPMTRLLLRKKS
ncbi:MAG: hypothetical protein Q9193_000717 [Seirophora villosa]